MILVLASRLQSSSVAFLFLLSATDHLPFLYKFFIERF
jgi:hypothetical protein